DRDWHSPQPPRAPHLPYTTLFRSFLVSPIQGNIKPAIFHTCSIDYRISRRSHIGWNRHGNQDIVGSSIIIVQLTRKSFFKQTKFKSKVGSNSFLPLDKRIGQSSQCRTVNKRFVDTKYRIRVTRDYRNASIFTNLVLTNDTETSSKL